MKPVYKIIEITWTADRIIFEKLKGLVSMCWIGDFVIIARHTVNKTTLKKILKDYLDK